MSIIERTLGFRRVATEKFPTLVETFAFPLGGSRIGVADHERDEQKKAESGGEERRQAHESRR
jgi:hypothetical protein